MEVQAETKKKSKKGLIVGIAVLLIIAAACAGFYYLGAAGRYFTTDNAKVTAKMYTITHIAAGKLLEWNIQAGDTVEKNQVLGRTESLPYVTSPTAGTVIQNNAAKDQMVAPTTALAVVADTNNLYIGVNIEETDIINVKIGHAVDVSIDAYPGKTFEGVVGEIDQVTQTYFSGSASFSTSGTYTKVTQLIPVKVYIANPENLPLTFGMNATVKIHIKEEPSEQRLSEIRPALTEATPALSYTSVITAAEQADVSPDVTGRVSSLQVKVGQTVEKDQILFTIDSTDYELQARQAAAAVTQAGIASQDARTNYDRMQVLFDAGAVSQLEMDTAKEKIDLTQAQLSSAQAAHELAQRRITQCTVKAPFDGEISAKTIDAGALASPQAPVLTIINTQNVKVKINVTETDLAKIKAGSPATVKVQSIGAEVQGSFTTIAPASNSQTGLFPVEIQIKNMDGKLKPGMTADVSI
ncbi:MAG: efflux RND transporter periplasmic adaptor subunit [Clostridia bacterium]|jgi:RND family efflux transporter MFP subunit|nr:efflux RND transporter periplasmic adaptor subunit [Clostridia bacterium]